MKCRVCRGPAVIDIRRHNAGFCRDHFIVHCREQVRRACDDQEMIRAGERVLVAVSGGKDSLALWEILHALGHTADGLYVGLGIGDYSDASLAAARAYAAPRGLTLHEVDMASTYGYSIPEAADRTRRAPCGACGLSKRHVFNAFALEQGYDVVATGHNLDDEAAVLLGNVLRWDAEYLGRQAPVLPAAPGFVRKVKPLFRISERESAAYCVLSGIDYQIDECPMAEGNRHLGYKAMLDELEHRSPGSKASFLFGFLDRGHPRFADDPIAGRDALVPCSSCGAPTPGEVCAFCRLREQATAPVQLRPRSRHRARRGTYLTAAVVRGPFTAGERALLIDSKRRRHLVTLQPGGEFHSHAGVLSHDDVIGRSEGISAKTTRGARLTVLRPTLSDYVLEMPRGAQVIYPKDLGPILMLADIFPGATVLESGVGSGALTTTLLRAVGPDGRVVGYEIREDFAGRARRNVEGFLGPDVPLTIEIRDVYEGIDEEELDRVVLDLPEPWRALEHLERTLRPGGILVSYLPTIGQVARLREALDASRFGLMQSLEVLHRTWHVEGQSVRPDHRMVAHTGFLTQARLLAPE